MEKKYGEFVFLEIESDDGTRYFVNPEKDVCLYKLPYRPDGKGEEFYMHNTKSHGIQYYRRSYLVNVSANYKNTFKHLFSHTSLSSDVVNKLECLCISLEIVFVDAHELCYP